MKKKNAILLLLLFLKFSQVYASVEIRSRQITTSDGLANNSVRSFFQDSKGFMWMATLNGLCRYDGSSFVTLRPESGDALSLYDHSIMLLTEDKNGFLWVATTAEIFSCYDLKRSCFVDYTGSNELKQRYSKRIMTNNGDVWLYHNTNGARQVQYINDKFTSIVYKEELHNLPSSNVHFVGQGQDGTVWIGTEKGLACVKNGISKTINATYSFQAMMSNRGVDYFLSNGRVFSFNKHTQQLVLQATLPHSDAGNILSGHFLLDDKWVLLTAKGAYQYDMQKRVVLRAPFIEDVCRGEVLTDNKGNYWIYNRSGKAWYVNKDTKKIKSLLLVPKDKISYVDNERYHVVHDSRGIIWISTYGNGLFAYDEAADELTHFTSNIYGLSYITSDFLQNVAEDRSGNIWVSSEFSGISKITPLNGGSYRLYPEDKLLSDRSNTVRMMYKNSQGDIWIGTRKGGLYSYDATLKMKQKTRFFHSNIYAMMEDSLGQEWLGTRGGGISINGVWYTHNDNNPQSLSNDNIFALYQDKRGRIWVGTFGGGLDLAMKTKDGYIFKHFFNQTYGQKQVRALNADQQGNIWVGTSEGVYIFDPDALIANNNSYWHLNTNNGHLKSNEIRTIFKDSKHRMWLGSSGRGVALCTWQNDYNKMKVAHYTTKDGLVNDVVQSITEDDQGNLWIGTEYGISKLQTDTAVFANYFFSINALGNVYTENCACKSNNGDLLFGSNYGLAILTPKQIEKSVTHDKVVYTFLRVNGSDASPGVTDSPLTQSLAYTDKIELNYLQNSFIINFSLLNYSDTQQFVYKLDAYDNQWSAPTTLNFVSYKNLSPGKYTLQVKAYDGSGLWNGKETSLQIVINPPFWATSWAIIFYILAGGTIVFFAFRITRDFTKLQRDIFIEKQLTDYKLVFFTNISHEFRTPLTLIQGGLEKIQRIGGISKEMSHPLHIMDKSTRRMLRLIDQLLEFRKMQNNKLALSLEETDAIGFLYEIFLSFGDIAESKNMDFQFVPSVPAYKMFIDKGKLDKITYNLLSNAFKYTPSGRKVTLIVDADEEKKELSIKVVDTGVGIPKEKQAELFKRFMQSNFSGQSVGVGLHLTNELVNVHKGTIVYNENVEGGSIFTVTLPIDALSYEEKEFLIPNNVLLKEQNKLLLIDPISDYSLPLDATPLNGRKVLIIEDDNDVRQFLKEEIGAYFEVETAEDGVMGLEKAQSYEPDLIVCDVLMPQMNGYEVTSKLKSEFNTSHIPIILLTALSSQENHLEGFESGADAYMTKPFSAKVLLVRIINLIEQRDKLRQRFSNEPGVLRPTLCSTDKDKWFIDKLHETLDKELTNADFNVDEFATQMGLGRTIFYKKVRGVTGYSPNEYIRILRMKKAAEMLLATNLTVAEVSYKVGINDPFYFSKCFKAQFGVAPSIYQKNGRAGDTTTNLPEGV